VVEEDPKKEQHEEAEKEEAEGVPEQVPEAGRKPTPGLAD